VTRRSHAACGADDTHEAFCVQELLARVEALARRPRAWRRRCCRWATFAIDQATREVRRAGELIELTPKEYTVLEYSRATRGAS